MAFTKYPELPKEIRLMIIDEAIRAARQESIENNRSQYITKPFLFPLSSIDYEWNRVIEMLLFNSIYIRPAALSDFAEICSKRHGRLNTILFTMTDEDVPSEVQPEDYVADSIEQLLLIMKDWDPLDRERQGLIEVQLDVASVWIRSSLGFNISTCFGALPEVPVIGALYEVDEPALHPSNSLCLYQSMPNARHVNLNLRFLDDETTSVEQASHVITSLGTSQPSLTHLELLADRHWAWDASIPRVCMPATDCIAAFPRSWYNSLVQLDLKRVNDLPLFLVEAGKIAWPNLKTLRLLGAVNTHDKTDDEIEVMNKRNCTDLVQGLIAMLPNTPNITTVLIEMIDYSWRVHTGGTFQFKLCLGNPVHGVEAGCEPCSYKFVSNHDNGVVVAAGTDFSGNLATELQHTVRHHQLKDLGVFFHNNKLSTWGGWRFCWQWDAEKSNWDAAFENEGDEFIYQMSQYIDLV